MINAAGLTPLGAPKPPGWHVVERRLDGVAWYNAKKKLRVIESTEAKADGKRWRHVSVSHPKRLPKYEEMAHIKLHFIGGECYAIMVSPPARFHVNIHERCLHLYSCEDGHPLPEFSGPIGGIRSI